MPGAPPRNARSSSVGLFVARGMTAAGDGSQPARDSGLVSPQARAWYDEGMSTTFARVILTAGLALAASCSKSDRVAGTPPTTAATTAPPAAPHAATPPVNAATAARVGAVVETMNAGGYTYVKLDLGGEQVWAAGPETKVAVGDRLQLVTGTTMTAFHSNTLDRTFDRIEFVPALPREGEPVAAPAAPAAAAPAVVTEAIAPAPGGQAIAATLAGAKGLAGKTITVRGKVVKFNAGILGRNWIHLQDGTGDLTLTTAPTAAPLTLGTVVVMRGTLALDQDFGGGYRYPVLVQDAAVVTP